MWTGFLSVSHTKQKKKKRSFLISLNRFSFNIYYIFKFNDDLQFFSSYCSLFCILKNISRLYLLLFHPKLFQEYNKKKLFKVTESQQQIREFIWNRTKINSIVTLEIGEQWINNEMNSVFDISIFFFISSPIPFLPIFFI